MCLTPKILDSQCNPVDAIEAKDFKDAEEAKRTQKKGMRNSLELLKMRTKGSNKSLNLRISAL